MNTFLKIITIPASMLICITIIALLPSKQSVTASYPNQINNPHVTAISPEVSIQGKNIDLDAVRLCDLASHREILALVDNSGQSFAPSWQYDGKDCP